MTSFEIRKKFIDFFKKNQHRVLPGSSLIPENDPSLLFVNAGMNQFKNIFLGLKKPPTKNVVTIQKCLRAGGKHNDLETVGETPWHHTFFEMLGNFSFGGYFKKEAIALAWEFLTEELKLNPEDLWISVYEKDTESYEIWRDEQNIPENKIYLLGEKDNFWQMGDTGPCGPCTEIHYCKGKEKKPDPNQLMEIWNLVFMEFYEMEKGKREKLSNPCVDTGMGLERLCSVLQNKTSNYHTDIFLEIILDLEKASGCKYDFEEKNQTEQQKAFRVLADHSRAICFLIADGVVEGNEKEGYVLKRIIRRALYYSQKLHTEKNLLQVGVEKTVSLMVETGSLFKQNEALIPIVDTYLSLKREEQNIQSVVERETKRFFDSLKTGRKQLDEAMKSLSKKFIPPEAVWNLYSTYGFPTDLTCLIAKEKGWTTASEEEIYKYKKLELERINKKKTEECIKESKQKLESLDKKHEEEQKSINKKIRQQQSLNKKCEEEQKLKKSVFNIEMKNFIKQYSSYLVPQLQGKTEKTFFTGYEKSKEKGQILLIGSVEIPDSIGSGKNWSSPSPKSLVLVYLQRGEEAWLVLDRSCFYPEGGGPVGDRGLLKTATGQAEVLDCQKEGNFIWHRIKVLDGWLEEGQKCQMKVNENFKKEISTSHTATHLLNSALRAVLGKSVRQAGSLVEPGWLRFDFTHSRALTNKECCRVEEQIWQSIEKEENLSSSFKSLEQAKEEGALFLKGENYGSEVRVISIGEKTSKELCGGIHVQNTREIKSFKIVSERGIQSGVRRIVAYTGSLAQAWEFFLVIQNLELREYLKLNLPRNQTTDSFLSKKENFLWKGEIEKQNPFIGWIEDKEKESKNLRKTIVRLEENNFKAVSSDYPEFTPIQSHFHPLASQILELREHLKLPLPSSNKIIDFLLSLKKSFETFNDLVCSPRAKKQEDKTLLKFEDFKEVKQTKKSNEISTNKQREPIKNLQPIGENETQKVIDFFEESEKLLNWFKVKEQEVKQLEDQLEKIKQLGFTKDKLLEEAKNFKLGDQDGNLLVVSFPLKDRKILSDVSDFLLSKLSSGVVILSGEGENQYPVLVNRTKNLEKFLSAGDILKNTVAPLCKGKGGGKPSFAQGSITDKPAFSQLEQILLDQWKSG